MSHSWKRQFVAYVEDRGESGTGAYVYLKVKIPRATADAFARRCAEDGQHAMVGYCDAFAQGLHQALNSAELKHLA